jgi:hypothetical protein
MTVANSIFTSNSAIDSVTGVGHGGVIYNQDGSTLTVIHSVFNGNSAYARGGFYNVGTLTVNDSTIINNSAISFAGTPGYTASPGVGGGFYNIGMLTVR